MSDVERVFLVRTLKFALSREGKVGGRRVILSFSLSFLKVKASGTGEVHRVSLAPSFFDRPMRIFFSMRRSEVRAAFSSFDPLSVEVKLVNSNLG